MKQKVLAYVVRRKAGGQQLLVFEHANDSKAGIQVPAGTVETGEGLVAALWRELREESGLQSPAVALVGKLAEAAEPAWDVLRHIYLLQAAVGLPERWTTVVAGDGEDHGMVFEYRWINIAPGPRLAGGQDRWLAQAAERLVQDQARS